MSGGTYERFTIFDNWGAMFDEMEDGDALALFRAMYRYAFDGIEPEFEKGSVLSLVWQSVRPNIDASGKSAKGGSSRRSKAPSETPSETPSERGSGTKGKGKGREKEREEEKKADGNSLGKNSHSADASDGAALADATPPAACPLCDGPMERTNTHKPNGTTLFRCKLCAEEVWA